MIPYERRQIMLNELENKEVVTLDDFSNVLECVSESTIRRDLKTLENEGQVVLLRGGAARIKQGSYDTSLNSRRILNIKEKEKIAKKAASLVKDGEVIYIDSGSTTLNMFKHLKDKKITIVTTNAMVFSEISETKMECILIGGDILISTASLVGPLTDNTLKDMHFDKAFIGASGYDLQSGINTPDTREANKKSIVKNNSKEVFVLVDSSKESKRSMCKAFELLDCILITDEETDFLKKHARYIIAD